MSDIIISLQREIDELRRELDRRDTATNARAQFTPLGGLAVRCVAEEALYEGEVVYVTATTSDGYVAKNPIDGDLPFGAVYKDAALGAPVWVVVSGFAYVLPEAAVTPVKGYIIYSSDATAGRVDQSATLPAVALHNREVGHWIDDGTGAGVKCRAVLHFN